MTINWKSWLIYSNNKKNNKFIDAFIIFKVAYHAKEKKNMYNIIKYNKINNYCKI
jgi:hypothetical protein